MVKLDFSHSVGFAGGYREYLDKARLANLRLHSGSGEGSDYLGWIDLPSATTDSELDSYASAAQDLRSIADVIIIIGIGGSYLGTKAILDAMGDQFGFLRSERPSPQIVFAGQYLSEDYISELLASVQGRSIAAVVVSKSGTTTEPAIAFRIIRREIEKRYGTDGARRRIAVVTGSRGALKELADREKYRTFIIPESIGGRFSVLSPVGLFPLAVGGIDIRSLIAGAAQMEAHLAPSDSANIAEQYAAMRNALYSNGYKIEILGSYEPRLLYFAEWWKQLFGESEGKNHKGIFPASAIYPADLHSIGQYIQDGERLLFETAICVCGGREVLIHHDEQNTDGLNFLAGKHMSDVNHLVGLSAALAHSDGGVPNIRIEIPEISEYTLGQLIYFFEKSCGISGYLLGVNPFDQPGVDDYKNNMFALLDKPGYEEEGRNIRNRLGQASDHTTLK